jgi:hypothetical protein
MRNKILVSVSFAGIVAYFAIGCASRPANQNAAGSASIAPLLGQDSATNLNDRKTWLDWPVAEPVSTHERR